MICVKNSIEISSLQKLQFVLNYRIKSLKEAGFVTNITNMACDFMLWLSLSTLKWTIVHYSKKIVKLFDFYEILSSLSFLYRSYMIDMETKRHAERCARNDNYGCGMELSRTSSLKI